VRVLHTQEVTRATPRTRIVRIALDSDPFPFIAGQAVIVGVHGATVRRPYSIACSPQQAAKANALELLVQIDDTDTADPHLEQLAPGTVVDVEGPLGSFGLPPTLGNEDILLVAGGTGIAPLRSMLWDTIEHRPANHLSLIYSVRSADEIAYEDELRHLGEQGRLDVRLTITRDGPEDWLGPRGRIDAPLIRSVVRSLETRCILCGPPAMISDVTALLIAVGIPADFILTETFST
jgi:glycine betaine catabolism B